MPTTLAHAKQRRGTASGRPPKTATRKPNGASAARNAARTPSKSAAEPLPPTLEIFALDHELSLPADLTSLDRFRDWVHSDQYPERGRFSFLNGAIVIDMSPENLHTHNLVKAEILVGISNWLRNRNSGQALADGALLINQRANLSTEPDAMFVCWESLRNGLVKYAEHTAGSGNEVEVVGSPDIVVEVVSPSSVGKDTRRLPPLYFKAGVREFWLVDARGKSVEFTIFRRGKRSWTPIELDAEGFLRSEVLGGSFRLDRGQNPVGGHSYTLQAKA